MPNHDPVKAKLRAALLDASPWCLDADALAAWLETNWVQEKGATDKDPREQKRRRNLIQQLAGASGRDSTDLQHAAKMRGPAVARGGPRRFQRLWARPHATACEAGGRPS